MHPRNPYASPPDFLDLAKRYPPLHPHVFLTHTGPTIDFKNESALRRLTEALLRLDFNISLAFPDSRLCPYVPSRLDYVLWIQDVVRTFVLGNEAVRGIDIGTGASAVCPLLACHIKPNWSFVATDIDKESLVSAQENVDRNNFSDRITIVDVPSSESPILQALERTLELPFHFTMCNPPFYASMEEFTHSAGTKEYGPSAVCIGSENEMVTPGGEVSFVSRIFTESLHHRMRCRWYTSRLAAVSSLPLIVGLLREHQVDNYAITKFVQGQIRRWAIAWSFGTLRLPDSLARVTDPTLQDIMPSRTTLYHPVATVQSSESLYNKLLRVLEVIEDIHIKSGRTSSTQVSSILVVLTGATWSWCTGGEMPRSGLQDSPQESTTFQCQISCEDGSYPVDEEQQAKGLHLVYQWIDGSDHHIFESFANHVNREVAAALESGL